MYTTVCTVSMKKLFEQDQNVIDVQTSYLNKSSSYMYSNKIVGHD